MRLERLTAPEHGMYQGAMELYRSSFPFHEHFCILPDLRNKKYGQRALELLKEWGKSIILEIDPPVDEISLRRKSFYERAGYRENPFSHVHPPYHAGYSGHPLTVMSCPEPLSEER